MEVEKLELLISIIVPGFNIEKYVCRCLNSIVCQSYKNLEVILVDDGSTDRTGDIFDDYAKRDHRIKVFHKTNGGVSSARNLGLKQAEGDYVLFLDGDDWLEEDAVKILVDVAKKYLCDVILFEYSVDYTDNYQIICLHPELQGVMTIQQAIKNTITPVNRFAVSKMYKRKILQQVFFDETIHLGEDTLFACEAMSNGHSAYFVSAPLYHYVQSSNSATRKTYFDERMLTGKISYYKLIKLCQEYYPEIKNIAVCNYVELLMTIVMDMYKEPSKNEIWIEEYTKEVRRYVLKLIKMKCCSNSTKLKAMLCCVNPSLMVKARTYSQNIKRKVKN